MHDEDNMSEAQLMALRAAARAAMPGPWHVDSFRCYVVGRDGQMVVRALADDGVQAVHRQDASKANLAYVAAANPSTVLGMLDEIVRLRALLAVSATSGQDAGPCGSPVAALRKPYPKHPGALMPGPSGAFQLSSGDRFVYDIDGRHGRADEFTSDGDALVCWDDGTYATIKWNHMSPEPSA
jgi:hypothetical protein